MAKRAKKRKAPKRETDLYGPVRDYLLAQGYTVRSEVLGCDIAAMKGDDLIVIELKLNCSTELLIQAARRQRITDSVYVAVPRPVGTPISKWRGIQHLLRRLEVGLILVSYAGKVPRVDVAFHPVPFDRKKQKTKRRAVIQEISGRSGDLNQGGSTRRRLVTAYREQAIHIACLLDILGPQSPKFLRSQGTGLKTLGILYDNVYGWFARVDRGVYGLTAEGKTALADYPELVAYYTLPAGR